MSLEMRAQCNSINFGTWELYARDRFCIPGKFAVAEPLTMKEASEACIMQPFARLDEQGIQQLMDDLWIGGMRPSKRLLEQVPLDHLKGEVEWNRSIIERLLPGRKR